MSNEFRHKLRRRESLFGCWCSLASPVTTEILGLAGFDWLLLDAEHAPNDVLTLLPQLMALSQSMSAPVVRPPANEPVIIKRLLDIGFQNFLVPFVESAEQAQRAVSATRYPPEGIRGVAGMQRANRYGTVANYFESANSNVTVLIQIETPNAVDAVDDICRVEGVDGIFIGPSDLAATLGHMGRPDAEVVQQAIRRVIASAQTAGIAVGILAPREEDARRYMGLGVSFIAVGSDQGMLRAASQALRDRYAPSEGR